MLYVSTARPGRTAAAAWTLRKSGLLRACQQTNPPTVDIDSFLAWRIETPAEEGGKIVAAEQL